MFGPLPTFQGNMSTLDMVRRQLSCYALSSDLLREKRYPYLDRDLLEFMYAVPREQLVRPGQRRSLMRRALVGIVPDDVLNRKRKAYVARSPILGMPAEFSGHTISSALGIVDARAFQDTLKAVREGCMVPIAPLLRAFAVEAWLTTLVHWKLLHIPRTDSKGTQQQALKTNSILASG